MTFAEEFISSTIKAGEQLERRATALTDDEVKIVRAANFLRAILPKAVDRKLKV